MPRADSMGRDAGHEFINVMKTMDDLNYDLFVTAHNLRYEYQDNPNVCPNVIKELKDIKNEIWDRERQFIEKMNKEWGRDVGLYIQDRMKFIDRLSAIEKTLANLDKETNAPQQIEDEK